MKPILISGAMDIEISYLIKKLNAKLDKKVANFEFYKAEELPIIILKTHMGMINSTLATSIAVSTYSPSMVINCGTLGGYADLKQNDIIIVEKSLNINAFDKPKGEKVDFSNWIHKDRNMSDKDRNYAFSDTDLVKIFSESPYYLGKTCIGTVGSGDVWNRENEFIEFLHKNLGVLGEDMETFAVGLTCNMLETPFIAIRIVANNEILGQEFDENTAILCQRFIESALGKLLEYNKCI